MGKKKSLKNRVERALNSEKEKHQEEHQENESDFDQETLFGIDSKAAGFLLKTDFENISTSVVRKTNKIDAAAAKAEEHENNDKQDTNYKEGGSIAVGNREGEIDLETFYESIPKIEIVHSSKLPIKNQKGVLIHEKPTRQIRRKQDSSDEEEKEESDQQVEAFNANANAKKSVKKQQKVEHKLVPETHVQAEIEKIPVTVTEIKQALANSALFILENPEQNLAELKSIQKFATDPRPTIVKITILTQLAVFKDIIPGYRIRKLDEAEKKETALSKQQRQLRNFEDTLLANYQTYLQTLESITKRFINEVKLVHAALHCMCELLLAVPHFNFRVNLLKVIVTHSNNRASLETAKLCCNAISTLFKDDIQASVSLECVKFIADMIHSMNYNVLPIVIDTFQHLRLQKELHHKVKSQKKIVEKRKRSDKNVHVSRKMRKVNEFLEQAKHELNEAEAVYDQETKQKEQSETLKFVFLTYLRVLKNAPSSPLIPSILEGLCQFAHLINIDFFQDLLNVLKSISATQHESYMSGSNSVYSSSRSALYCIVSAFELMDAVGGALPIDLTDFYTALYVQIMRLSMRPGVFDRPGDGVIGKQRNEIDLLLKGVETMMQKKREVPLERVASFVKRLGILCLSTPSNSALASLVRIKAALAKFQRIDCFLDEDGRVGTGRYDALLEDPNMCNPFATSLWEIPVLANHYHPAVSAFARDMIKNRVDFTGTDLNMSTIMGSKGDMIDVFSVFSARKPKTRTKMAKNQESGEESKFSIFPRVLIPPQIRSLAKKSRTCQGGRGRAEGPTALYPSEFLAFLQDVIEKDSTLS